MTERKSVYNPQKYCLLSEHRQSCWITAARCDPVTSGLHVVNRENYKMEDMQGGNDSGSQFWTSNEWHEGANEHATLSNCQSCL